MPIDFYYSPPSPPCRSVMLLAKAIGVHLNLKLVDVLKGEQMKPEFLKINPQHVVPTMDDNGFVLCESRPIMGYLVSKYAKNDSLYPREPRKRAAVDEILYFDNDPLFANIKSCYTPVLFGSRGVVYESDVAQVEKSLEGLSTFLVDKEFLAGDSLTIADFSVTTNVCLLQCFGFDIGRYENVAVWFERCKELLDKFGFEEIHGPPTRLFTQMYRANLQESS